MAKAKKIKEQAEPKDILAGIAEELFSLMGTKAKLDVSWDKENEAFTVDIEADDETGLLIGRKGETLTSIQTVLGIMLKGKTGEWSRILVNVGNYREKEEDYLKNLAQATAERARETGEPQSLYNLKPGQRRTIHMFLSEDKTIATESAGEGLDRYLVVTPVKK